MSISAVGNSTPSRSAYSPPIASTTPKPGEAKPTNPGAAKSLDRKQGKLDDDVRQKRCEDIIENDERAVKLAAAVPGATPKKQLDVYA